MRTTLLFAVLALSASTFVASLPLEPGNIEARVAAPDVINEDALALEARGNDKKKADVNKPLPPTPKGSISSTGATDGSKHDSHKATDGSSLTHSGTHSGDLVHVGGDGPSAKNGKGNTNWDKVKQKVFNGKSGNGGGP